MSCEIGRHWANWYWTIEQFSTSLYVAVYRTEEKEKNEQSKRSSSSTLTQSCPQQTLRHKRHIQNYTDTSSSDEMHFQHPKRAAGCVLAELLTHWRHKRTHVLPCAAGDILCPPRVRQCGTQEGDNRP